MDADLGELGRRRRRGGGGTAFSPLALFASGEQGVWYDPSDLTPEKTSWRRNLLTYSQDFENAIWTKTNASLLSNLALYSQDFDNAGWGKTGSTVTANVTTAPDGTTTADKLVEDTSTGQHRVLQAMTVSSGVAYAYSIYVKADTRSRISIFDNSSASDTECIFDLSNGTVVRQGAAATAIITSVGSGWYRCTTVSTPSATTFSATARLVSTGTTSSYTGDGTSGLFIWGAQVNAGSTVQTYTRSLATAAPILFSDALGGTAADKLVENAIAGFHQLTQSVATVGTPQTLSIYAKAAERTQIAIQLGANGAFYNLSNGTVISGIGASIVDVGNGWYRCVLTNTPTSTNVLVFTANGGTANYTGDGTSGILIYGAQLESASSVNSYQRITDFTSNFVSAFPTHALFQESTGFTPVTALGQSVGLVLDKRTGGAANLGAELVSNGDFSSGATGWITTSWVVSGGTAEIISASDSIAQNVTLVAGRTYRVTYTVTSFSGTGGVRPRFFGGTTVTGTTVSNAGTYAEYLVAVTGNTQVALASTTATCAVIIDNISVREVPGNHALQATSASRPTLQARANLLTFSEQFDNAAWTNVGTPTVTANTTLAPDGTTTADTINDSSAVESQGRRQTVTIPASTTIAYTSSVYILKTSGTPTIFPIVNLRMTGGTTVDAYIALNTTTGETTTSGAVSGSAVNAGTYWRVTLVAANNGTANTSLLYTVFPAGATTLTTSLNVAATGSQVFWGAQVEAASTASTYQRVVTATDYADVGLPRNLLFDGVDDSLATTGNVDFSATDKMSLFSGLTKASDAAAGQVVELSADSSANNGSFGLTAPTAAAATTLRFRSTGTLSSFSTDTSFAAPVTGVITGLSEILTDTCILRKNGTQVATSASDQGTGTYLSYPLYIGRRNNATLPFNGRIFQLIIRGAATDSVTVINAEQYVAQRTGVTL